MAFDTEILCKVIFKNSFQSAKSAAFEKPQQKDKLHVKLILRITLSLYLKFPMQPPVAHSFSQLVRPL